MEKNIFSNHISGKWLTSKIYKESYNIAKKHKNPSKNCAKDLSRYFSKEDTSVIIRYMKRYSMSQVTKIMQIKTPTRLLE